MYNNNNNNNGFLKTDKTTTYGARCYFAKLHRYVANINY